MNKSSFLGRFWKIFALDIWLLIGLFAITGYGLLVLYSASGGSERMFTNRVIQVCLGLGVMFVMAMFPPRFYEKVSPYLYIVCIILLELITKSPWMVCLTPLRSLSHPLLSHSL